MFLLQEAVMGRKGLRSYDVYLLMLHFVELDSDLLTVHTEFIYHHDHDDYDKEKRSAVY